MERPKQFDKSPETEVWNAIDAFEQILEAMPDDRTALETLYEAYDTIGDKTRALEHLIALANLVIEEGDADSVPWVYHALTGRASQDERADHATRRLDEFMANMGFPSPSEMAPQSKVSNKSIDVSTEMTLAWNLLQADEVDQDEYSQIVKDLTENSTKSLEVPITVLHALNDRANKNVDRIVAFMSRDSGIPVISLMAFEMDRRALSLLGPEFVNRQGALVFAEMSNEPLVAVLNPYNETLKEEIRTTVGGPCHFYLTTAHEYDEYVNRSRQPKQTATTAGVV